MNELAKSAIRFPWAMSLFGMQQFATLFAPGSPTDSARRVQGSLYNSAEAIQQQLGDLMFAAFQVGDELQSDLLDLAFDSLSGRAFSAEYVQRLTNGLTQQSAETLRTITPGNDLRLAWQQLQNNFEVYNLVKQVAGKLGIPPSGIFDLPEMIERSYALGQYPDLWAIEGLGHDYAAMFWNKRPLRGLLLPENTPDVPQSAMTMLHAGIGLFFAQTLLPTINPYLAPAEVRSVLQQFISLVRENSRPGYAGAALESLGLVTRTWHPRLLPIIDHHLRDMEPEVATFLWHGVGRALYFLPIHFVPGVYSPWLSANTEPPDDLARRNAFAGLAWATALVNIRQPQILASILRYHRDTFTRDDSFTNGVVSTMIMASDITPHDVYVRSFLEYQPDEESGDLVELWSRLVKGPVEAGVNRYYPVLQRNGQLEEVFHYADLASLAGGLPRQARR
jgi:hypothetical protein